MVPRPIRLPTSPTPHIHPLYEVYFLIDTTPYRLRRISIAPYQMDTVNPRVEDVDKGSLRLELSPEDNFVTLSMEDHSEIYRDLVKVQNDVSDPDHYRSGNPSLTFRAGMEQ